MVKPIFSVKLPVRFIFFLLFSIIIYSLREYIALDSFINTPEKIFFPKNEWAIPLFYENLYPAWGYIYFTANFIFTLAVIWLIPSLFRWLFKEKKMLDFLTSTCDYESLNDFEILKKLAYIPFLYVITDIWEGYLNLRLIIKNENNPVPVSDSSLELIGSLKLFFIVASITYMLFLYIVHRVIDRQKGISIVRRLRRFINKILRGNYASILIALIFFYLILNNPQGKILLLQLIHSPFNVLFIFIPLIIIVSLMTLTNTYYINFKYYQKTKLHNQNQNGKYFNWNLLGDKEALHTRSSQANVKRYLTLNYFLMAIVLLINLVTLRYEDVNISWLGYFLSVLIVGSIYFYIWKMNRLLKGADEEFLKRFSFRTSISGIITIASLLAYSILSIISLYNLLSLKIITLIIFFSALAFYISHIILVRRSPNNFSDPITRKIKVLLANDYNFIQLQKLVGLFVLIISITQFFGNFDFFYDSIKSINIVLIYVFLGFWFFYRITSAKIFAIEKNHKKKIALMNLGTLAFIGLVYYSFTSDNKYFTVKLIEFSEQIEKKDTSGIELKTYLERRLTNNDAKNFYLIANEGGGLRANYWSLLVLSKLDSIAKIKGANFFENTLVTSGASGGNIGQSLYNLMQADTTNIIKSTVIDNIGNVDHLASDLYSLCFRRPIIALIPLDLSSNNNIKIIRGDNYASRRYARLAVAKESWVYKASKEKAFKAFWRKAYENNEGRYPLSIINSTHAEYGTEGIGTPLTKENNEAIFNSSVSYLEINHESKLKSISFLDAAFLSNRFPLVSSPAIVPTKGHFIDAGVFDNYGISSILDLMWYIQKKADLDEEWNELWMKLKGKLKLIIISNGRNTYIKNKYDTLRIEKGGRLFNSSNLKGSFGAAVSASAVKEYLTKRAQKLNECVFEEVILIDLPYLLKNGRDDVQKILKIQVQDISLDAKIKSENQEIKRWLKEYNYDYGIYLDPPLGRSLSKPVTDYMKYMAEFVIDKQGAQVFD